MGERDYRYKNTTSKDGSFSCHVNRNIAAKLAHYCDVTGTNKTKLCNKIIEEWLEGAEEKALTNMSKEELINIILNKKEK